MKRKYFGFLLVLICSVIFFSCDKEGSVELGGAPDFTQGTFRAKIDGVQWTADKIKSASIEGGVIAVVGMSMDGNNIVLRVGDTGVHNYSFHSLSFTNIATYTDSSLVPIAAMTTNQWLAENVYGTMNVTSINTVRKTISGTFAIKVIRSMDGEHRDITDGVFTDIPYGTPPPSVSDTLQAKVDGVNHSGGNVTGILALNRISINSLVNGASIAISVADNILPGTFPIDLGSDEQIVYNNASGDTYSPSSGTLQILEHNTSTRKIRGTFSATMTNLLNPSVPDVNLTDGYFSVGY